MSDVDFYIMRFNPEVQQRLTKMRRTIFDVFKGINERIYYGIPTISNDSNEIIMHYAAYKGYISIILGYGWVDFLRNQYPQYQYTRATIQFQHKEPFPDEVIQAICELLKQGHCNANHTEATSQPHA